MQALTHRKFVATSALLAGGAALGLYGVASHNKHRGAICLLPVEGVTYSETFSRFMKRVRFDSFRDALASIRDRKTPVRIAHLASSERGNRAAICHKPWIAQAARNTLNCRLMELLG